MTVEEFLCKIDMDDLLQLCRLSGPRDVTAKLQQLRDCRNTIREFVPGFAQLEKRLLEAYEESNDSEMLMLVGAILALGHIVEAYKHDCNLLRVNQQ